MNTQSPSEKNQDPFCNKIWLTPIAHQKNTSQPEHMGLEMEMHAFDAQTFAPLGTENAFCTPQDVLKKIVESTDETLLLRDASTDVITGVKLKTGGNFSLEPGGQIEYSSKPTATLYDLVQDVSYGLSLLEKAGAKQILFLSHGTNPISTATHPLIVPKERYKYMTRYFESAPPDIRGIDMMRHSATVQPNFDIFVNAEWHTGVRLLLQLVPITNQMFANSKFFHGKKSLFPSERQNIWEHMDPTRSGYPTNLTKVNCCPQTECEYAKWAKKAYMLFVNGMDADKQPLYGEITFEQWLENGYHGVYPTARDWETHLGSLFPHLRLRKFLEIRNIDAQPFEHTFAPLAFYSALLKNKDAQKMTWDLLKKYSFDKENIFAEQHDYSHIFQPLLTLACEILKAHEEKIGVLSLKAFETFLLTRDAYWNEPDGLSFVKKQSTYFPAKEFDKHFKILII